jgi:hypothetical protein
VLVLLANPIAKEAAYMAAIVNANLDLEGIDWVRVTDSMKLQVKKVRKGGKAAGLVREVTDQVRLFPLSKHLLSLSVVSARNQGQAASPPGPPC